MHPESIEDASAASRIFVTATMTGSPITNIFSGALDIDFDDLEAIGHFPVEQASGMTQPADGGRKWSVHLTFATRRLRIPNNQV